MKVIHTKITSARSMKESIYDLNA